MEGNLIQSPCHNVESIFYVMLYMCMMYKGLGLKQTQKDLKALQPFAIDNWFMPEPFYKLSFIKAGHLRNFQQYFVSKFTPYFAEFGDLMTSLLRTLFPNNDMNNCLATHDAMLELLNVVFEHLLDEQSHEPKSKPN